MANYDFKKIEDKWQQYWKENQNFRVDIDKNKPKYYVLDMFPYPSGTGLHVGHPLGYIASDIVTRYKRLKGFNVLHPMGFDAFGLPAEQYAIQTGQHPAITTENNIKRYKEQLCKIGFSFDWSREVRTCDPKYYKWTQWIFIQLFNCWYNNDADKAEPIVTLIKKFETSGISNVNAASNMNHNFSAGEWKSMPEKQQQEILLSYRLAYLADTTVNWCPELGTVLSNEEVKDGVSERGGHPVVRKEMKGWCLRITAYAERLLKDLEKIHWPEPLKEMQRNWIGRSEGAVLKFEIRNSKFEIRNPKSKIENSKSAVEIFTTRPDTIFGATFMVLAPEHELVEKITTDEHKKVVKEYVEFAKNRPERDRLSLQTITGEFTGAYAIHPFTKEKIPVWVADYVLAGYGTGAIMAVPAHDSRDYAFAKHLVLPIKEVITGGDVTKGSHDDPNGTLINSDFLNGLNVDQAIKKTIEKAERAGIGKGKVNYKLRDAIFSRQRYWGEPFPIYFKNGMPYVIDHADLPLILPEIDEYKPTETGKPPLGRAKNWKYKGKYPLELSTMPGWAGSSWYYLRYMDAGNEKEFVSKQCVDYWQNIDFYIGGAEHATGHLLYVRFWTKFLHDLGYLPFNEPAKKLINQGMIQGRSNFVYRIRGTNKFVSYNLRKKHKTTALHVDVNFLENDVLDLKVFRKWRPEFADAEFILEDGKYICGVEIEKMSKSKHNIVTPDDVIEKYGADTLRLYEMFLGPLEQFKPWNTHGIEGVLKFLKKLWMLFHNDKGDFIVSEEEPTKEELKIIHKTIKKVEEDIERYSFNTSVSTFMICVNELMELKCNKKAILQDLVIILSPFAPHIAEELWERININVDAQKASFPKWSDKYLAEDSYEYPVSVNGKLRAKITFPLGLSNKQIEKEVLASEKIQKWVEGKTPKKVIVVPKKIVNVVV
ncbi:MAG: leucine--tRNA ligase [Cytophagales bacterium]|nr:leucine--tRNA ligase [Cytophagales bacterium]